MSKRNKVNRKRKEEHIEEFSLDSKKLIKIIIIMAITLGVFYLITVGILSKKESVVGTYNPSIQYTKILAGESFSQKRKEYLVLYYDSKKDNMDDVHSLISDYNEKDNKTFLYTVDMSEAFNKEYVGNESNTSATKASELKIAGITLIHFKDNKIVNYITNDIGNYLK